MKNRNVVELRSDTFTMPTPEMRTAIAAAELGDDGYREDPTVNRLEALAAAKLGKQAACLMPSGTMANLACILAHSTGDGGIALVGDRSDICLFEDEGLAARLGVRYELLPTDRDGTIPLPAIRECLEQRERGAVKLLCLENPHNICGGVVLPMGYLREVANLARLHGVRVHTDGARIFNAAVKLQVEVAEIVDNTDSVQFCLSKGLAAPVGSMVAGSVGLIASVRKYRRMLGGNLRQAGIVAANRDLIERLSSHPLARAFRPGKTVYSLLEEHLVRRLNGLDPGHAARILSIPQDELARMGKRILKGLPQAKASVVQSQISTGGGSSPDESFPSLSIELSAERDPEEVLRELRTMEIPIIGTIESNRVRLSLATMYGEDERYLSRAIRGALGE